MDGVGLSAAEGSRKRGEGGARRHLPAPATPLVGREADLAELRARLAAEPTPLPVVRAMGDEGLEPASVGPVDR